MSLIIALVDHYIMLHYIKSSMAEIRVRYECHL